MSELWTVVLAAGEGKRMRSGRAKVLHPLAGRPLALYPVVLARAVGTAGMVVVVGHQGKAVRETLATGNGGPELRFAEQPEQRGTGHALLMARESVPETATELLLLYADVPLLERATVERLLARHRARRAAATVLTFTPASAAGYGRIVRRGGRGRVLRIVEERDATPAQRRLRECNSGIYCFDPRRLWAALDRLTPDNDQGELYLTDVIGLLARGRQRVESLHVDDPVEVAGVNDRRQLAELDAVLRQRILARLMLDGGVTVLDPTATYVESEVVVGRDTVLYPGVRLEGRTVIGEECTIGTGCHLTDTTVGDRVTLRPYCVAAGSVVEGDVTLGPFARLRPGAVLRTGADIGNFIEIKKSTIGRKVKAHHVGYIGDATVGDGANIGAGTITCNYDGFGKHETRIGARAFVGTNASLVAPLTIGDDAYVGAGSVITQDVPAGALALGRAHQVVKEGWAERRRARTPGAEPPRGS